jgi:hypothetical protein
VGYFPFATAGSSGGGYPAEPVVSGTPTAGQVLTAETATTATWEASTGNTLTRVEWIVPSSGATHDAAANELTAVSTSSWSGTVVLPTAPAAAAGTVNAVKQIILGGGNEVTVETQGSDVFSFTGGATSQTLTLAGQALLAHYDGVSVWTVYADDLPASQIVVLGQDLGNTSALPEVISTHLTVVTNAAATGTLNLDPTNTRAFVVTQTGNVTTFTLTSGTSYAAGIEYSFDLYINPSTFTTAWPANVTWAGGGSAPTLTPSTVNVLTFATVNAGTTWYGATVDNAPSLPLIVGQGGTGAITLGAYELVTGGITSTSPLQSVAGVGTGGQVLQSQGASALPVWAVPYGAEPLTSGEAIIPRVAVTPAGTGLTSGVLGLTYWVAATSGTATAVTTCTAGTAASGLTYANIGIYTIDVSGNLTLVASTGDLHTTLWVGTFTTYTSSLTSSFTRTAGTRYALGVLGVGTTTPILTGVAPSDGGFMAFAPVLARSVSGQATLPSSVAAGSIIGGSNMVEAILAP